MIILVIGDVIGRPGRNALKRIVPELRHKFKIDWVIANGENAAGGLGLNQSTAQELMDYGVDIITSGNHIWQHKEFIPSLDDKYYPVIRPLNYPPGIPGRGYIIKGQLMVVNLIGRTFLGNFDCPFRAMDTLLSEVPDRPPAILVDFHAEATSEKVAMGHYLDGRVSAVVGTHTHVGTIDTRVLPNGTAYVTDLGMVGPLNSVIGDDKDAVLQRFLTMIPSRLPVARGKVQFNSTLISIDNQTGRASSIDRIDLEIE